MLLDTVSGGRITGSLDYRQDRADITVQGTALEVFVTLDWNGDGTNDVTGSHA